MAQTLEHDAPWTKWPAAKTHVDDGTVLYMMLEPDGENSVTLHQQFFEVFTL